MKHINLLSQAIIRNSPITCFLLVSIVTGCSSQRDVAFEQNTPKVVGSKAGIFAPTTTTERVRFDSNNTVDRVESSSKVEKISQVDEVKKAVSAPKMPNSDSESPFLKGAHERNTELGEILAGKTTATETSQNNDSSNQQQTANRDGEVTIEQDTNKLSDAQILDKPKLPEYSPRIEAPNKLNHPLKHSTKLTFMLGEDDNGYYLYGEGPITKGAYKKFLRYVEHFESQGISLKRIMFHSPGGLVNEGLQIGYYIHDNNWATDSDRYMQCYSSCGFIYAAGTTKRIQQGAKVGFHRPYFPNKEDTDEIKKLMYQDYQPYWTYIKGNKDLYDTFMKDYDRDEMFILDTQNISNFMNVEKY